MTTTTEHSPEGATMGFADKLKNLAQADRRSPVFPGAERRAAAHGSRSGAITARAHGTEPTGSHSSRLVHALIERLGGGVRTQRPSRPSFGWPARRLARPPQRLSALTSIPRRSQGAGAARPSTRRARSAAGRHQCRRRDRRGETRSLILDDRLAKRLALDGIVASELQGSAGDPDGLCRDHRTGALEGPQRSRAAPLHRRCWSPLLRRGDRLASLLGLAPLGNPLLQTLGAAQEMLAGHAAALE